MHELYATKAVLDTALRQAAQQKAVRIKDLYLVLGEVSSYTEDSVLFYWDELSRGTMAAGARLHFRRVEAELQCMACFTKYRPIQEEIQCPVCGSLGAKILSGEEFYVEALDVE